jgi:hypothetical protein
MSYIYSSFYVKKAWALKPRKKDAIARDGFFMDPTSLVAQEPPSPLLLLTLLYFLKR